ncbi:retinitis pigmentosa 1-like 1 protein [Echinops telfairi]|uniref:Retinitis pigmentosa 1-like 1 protein n=1 Tax=Echinops telfairi TaxID=9371 RepID=A0ABM0ZRM1_ECHTE|nr:retinitis pigmentosa 1-like 1 protein [Echinops telfairi]
MSGHQRDGQVPTYRECLLPFVARTSSVAQITPAKKITFLKRGDARFSGVQLAVHQRTFKSFGALMDELSQRVPLSFGVRSVTTPRGLHCLSTLEQLEDGGCYFCSDRKAPQASGGLGRQQGRGPAAQLSGDFEGQRDASGTPSSWKGPKAPRRILLVKNTEPRFQRTVVLSPRDTSSFAAFLRKASDLLHVPVKRVFTASGKKVDSLHGLLHSPLVLVCAGQEPFRPPAMEHFRRSGTETISDLTSKNKNGSWGPKAKPSIIHSRSKSGGRSRPLSGLSERSGLSNPPGSLHRTWLGSALHRHPQDTPAHLGPLVAGDDFEKQVHMNEDGSLSVEMKIRLHLLSEDTLLWSTGVRRASDLTTANEEHSIPGDVAPVHCVWEGSPGCFSEPGALRRRPCESGGQEDFKQEQQAGPGFEIWTNPLFRSQEEEIDAWRRGRLTQNRHSRPLWSQGGASKKTSKANASSVSNQRPAAGSEPDSSYRPRTTAGSMGSCSGHQASRNRGLQAEVSGRAMERHQTRGRSVSRLPMALGHSGSWDAEECLSSLSSCAPAQRRGRKLKSQAPGVSLPSTPGSGTVSQKSCQRAFHCPLESPTTKAHRGKMRAQQVSQSRDIPEPISGACFVCTRYCPTPPRGQPCVKKHSSSSSSNSSSRSNQRADWRPDGSKHGPGKLNGLSTLPLSTDLGARGRTIGEIRRSSPRPRGTSQGKMSGDGADLEEPEEDGGMVPSALPHFSPEAVVCEWLTHIPEDPILMKYEMADESPTVAGVGPEGPQEGPVDRYSLEGLGELARAREPQPLEGAASERPKLDTGPGTDDAGPQSEEALSQRGASEKGSDVYEEARASKRRAVGHSISKGALPIRMPTSVQIMRAFISSKPGRPSSMPEVSTVVGRRLGHFAHSLLTCLAGLHFFDEDHGSPARRVRFTDSPRFQELLATLQSLWPQCDEGELGHQEFRLGHALSILASHPVTEDITLTSSSGVDVSSGSAGSGEGSGPCPGKGTFPPGRMELPLQMTTSFIPCQEPGTRTSEEQEGLGNQHPICPKDSSEAPVWACNPSPDEAGEKGRDHVLGSSLEQLVESTTQKEGIPAGKSQEEIEKEERQEASDQEEEFLDEEGINRQEVTRLQGRGAGSDRDSTDVCPAGMNQEPTELWNRARESSSPARELQSGLAFEPDLKKLAENDGMAAEQSQVTPSQGTGANRSPIAPRVPLDPGAIWVHKLLKKMEKAFMTHFASAATSVRAHWGLQHHHVLDQMVAELEQDLGRRLQDSITKELSKIPRRTGRKAPRPPREALHWEMSLQTGQRRRRLQGLHNLSAFTEPTGVSGFSLEDEPFSSGTLGAALGAKVEEEEFCPCETCLRKNMSPTSPRAKMEAGGAPIEKAFDLQQILQKRKGGRPDGEAAEDGGVGLVLEASLRTRTVQGADEELEPGFVPGSGVDEGAKKEGHPKPGRTEALQLGEAEGTSSQERQEDLAAQPRDGTTDTGVGNDLESEWEEQGVNEKEESMKEDTRDEGILEGEASRRGDPGPGGEDDGADAIKAQESKREGPAMESGEFMSPNIGLGFEIRTLSRREGGWSHAQAVPEETTLPFRCSFPGERI